MKSEQGLQQERLKSRWKTQENRSGAGQIRKDSDSLRATEVWSVPSFLHTPRHRFKWICLVPTFEWATIKVILAEIYVWKCATYVPGKPQSTNSFMQNYPQLGRKRKIRENDELKTTSYTVNIHQIHKTRMPVRYALQEHAAGFSRHSCKNIFAQVLKKAGVVVCHNFPTVFPTHKAYKCNWHVVSIGALKRWQEFAPIKITESQRNSQGILGVLTGISLTSVYTDFCCCG